MAIDDDEERKDLTRIESLPEFLHDEDPDVDQKFDQFEKPKNQELSGLTDLHDLETDSPPPLPDLPYENEQEQNTESTEFQEEEVLTEQDHIDEVVSEPLDSETFNIDETMIEGDSDQLFGSDQTFDEAPIETSEIFQDNSFETSSEEVEAPNIESLQSEDSPDESLISEENDSEIFMDARIQDPIEIEEENFTQDIPKVQQENFEEVKQFAQNFSYGKVESEGNPPYSIIVSQIKTQEDSEDILSLLKEFQIINQTNSNEYQTAAKLGAILIPQISEFVAIVLAHKFRRFDVDLKVGLADEIHLSKNSSSLNSTELKGLIKKESLLQNKDDSYFKSSKQTPIEEIIISTTSNLEGFEILQYIGTEYSYHLYDEDEFERIHFTQKELEKNSQSNHLDEQDAVIYKDYLANNEHIFQELLNTLKQKAHKKNANAILSVQFQTNLITESNKSFYQLSCSGTLCYVGRSK